MEFQKRSKLADILDLLQLPLFIVLAVYAMYKWDREQAQEQERKNQCAYLGRACKHRSTCTYPAGACYNPTLNQIRRLPR